MGEGDVFNPEYFRRINLPAQEDAASFAMINSIADLRDGFPSQMFSAEFVMFVDPFSTMFSTVQQAGYQVYDMLLHDQFIAQYYVLDQMYSLANHEAKLYRKIRPIDRACVDVLKERLRSHYPDTPLAYEPVYFLALMEYGRHMIFYDFFNKALRFHMENGRAVRFHLTGTNTLSRRPFEVESRIPGMVLVVTDQDKEIFRSSVPDYSRTAVNQDISDSDSLTVRLKAQPQFLTLRASSIFSSTPIVLRRKQRLAGKIFNQPLSLIWFKSSDHPFIMRWRLFTGGLYKEAYCFASPKVDYLGPDIC